ncbi:MAG: flavodoxin family protein [Deltaproteobacteria bacterium]|nr:flavodoxin family protein [Deltaproteobacteria bacterium]
MKVLAFNGSPRRGGNTETLLSAVAKGVELAGGEIEIIRLADLTISPCLSCGGCDKTGICVLKDDMGELYEKIGRARRIILASPIYFYGVTAHAKAFVDRAQALWSKKNLLKKKGQWCEDPDRLGFFVSVAATKGEKIFDGAVLTAKYFYDALGVSYGGAFLVKGVDKRGEMEKAEEKIREAEEFGRRITG